ncbi:hypothetical protein [Streptomyces sp. NPDC059994]|uniref:hypothetical protein n=1 Tax=Streptomyces sp. NPDC059994 TaxID=3347029 RepID=UPI0036BD55D2
MPHIVVQVQDLARMGRRRANPEPMRRASPSQTPSDEPEETPVNSPCTPSYSLYAERDGLAYGWDGFADHLHDAGAARAWLAEARRELAKMNAVFGFNGLCYIHLLQHPTSDCACLEAHRPGRHCHVMETYAPQREATAARNQAAALTWLEAHCQQQGISGDDLNAVVEKTRGPAGRQAKSTDRRPQLAALLGRIGQSQLMEMLRALTLSGQDG